MIEVLKQMVEALEWCHGGEPCGTAEAIAVVEKALANVATNDTSKEYVDEMQKQRHEQEPVATAFDVIIEDEALKILDDMVSPSVDDECNPILLLVGEGHSGYGIYIASADYPNEGANFLVPTPKLYTSPFPPQRKPLTDEEIDHIYTGVRAVHLEIDSYVFARTIEAAHGIKE